MDEVDIICFSILGFLCLICQGVFCMSVFRQKVLWVCKTRKYKLSFSDIEMKTIKTMKKMKKKIQ